MRGRDIGSKPPPWPYTDMPAHPGSPAPPPCCCGVLETTLLARFRPGEVGCCCCCGSGCCWWSRCCGRCGGGGSCCACGDAGCTAVEIRLLLGLSACCPLGTRAGPVAWPEGLPAGLWPAECEHSTACMGAGAGRGWVRRVQGAELAMIDYSMHAIRSPSPSAADRALSSSSERDGSAAEPAALAPSKDTAVEIWLLAALCKQWAGENDHEGASLLFAPERAPSSTPYRTRGASKAVRTFHLSVIIPLR